MSNATAPAPDTTYNGWTNYATWRINLEMFDGRTWEDFYFRSSKPGKGILARALEIHATDYITDQNVGGLVEDYALAFLNQVDWHEIASHMLDD